MDAPPVPALIESISEAKSHFSAIVDGAVGGKSFIICRSGRPVAVISPDIENSKPRRIGLLKGKLRLPADWYRRDKALDREIEKDFRESIG